MSQLHSPSKIFQKNRTVPFWPKNEIVSFHFERQVKSYPWRNIVQLWETSGRKSKNYYLRALQKWTPLTFSKKRLKPNVKKTHFKEFQFSCWRIKDSWEKMWIELLRRRRHWHPKNFVICLKSPWVKASGKTLLIIGNVPVEAWKIWSRKEPHNNKYQQYDPWGE